jgi:hypothetical protein
LKRCPKKKPYIVKVVIKKQRLYLLKDGHIIKQFHVSTSKFGIGNKAGSNETPLGWHKIVRKIGDGSPLGTIFVGRRNTRRIAEIFRRKPKIRQDGDLITTRILRLRGLEEGVNKGKGIDTYKRFIYIHGTRHEWLIGKPASHGCVRMRNKDIVRVFEAVSSGTLVLIEK